MSGFDGERAFRLVQAQCALGPRPTGSPANRRCAELIASTLAECGWPVEEDAFLLRGQRCRNLLARTVRERPALLLGAHFDTRPRADRERSWWRRRRAVPGANDGASGVAVLLELARLFHPPPGDLWLAFFDAEDHGRLDGWDYCAGSARMASTLLVRPAAVIVADMVGAAGARFFVELYAPLGN
ncbi:MAG: M28 family peptidase [Thermoanaerobaculaceae bacterium]|nr:M28 family peptidase [Thermoanaerobaculaceae bacterium]MDI9620249.1 M28 family peptidase [Acidobacteriota bacterium]NLH12521.1 M28 family peptidase [Holophagae bacterium]